MFAGVENPQINYMQKSIAEGKRGPGLGQNPYRNFNVYDLDVEELADASIALEDIKPIGAAGVMILTNSRDACAVGSRVSDEHVRNRIIEYFNASAMDVGNWMELRRAATNAVLVPGFGKYTYQNIKEETEKGENYGVYSPDKLTWLEDYIERHNIVVPTL